MKPWFAFSSETERLIAACGWILFAVTALWAICFVPMNMDEALAYQPLACLSHPFSVFHVFEEGCDGRYDLTTFFGFRIMGAYHYVGALSSILYAPFYFLFHTPRAQYFYGLVFFVLFALLLSRLTAKPQITLPIILSFFPFVFQFIHDTGPVKFSLLAFPLGAMLLRGCASAKLPLLRYAYALALALGALLAIEDKIFFVYLLPCFTCFCLAFLDELDWMQLFARAKKCARALLLAALIVAAGILTLLFAQMGDHSYLYHLTHVQAHLEQKQAPGGVLISCFLLLLAWPAYAHRVFDMEMIDVQWIVVSMILTAIFFIACFILVRKQKLLRPLRPRTELLIFSFFAALLAFLGFSKVWAGHHFIFLWVPAIVLFADCLAELTPAALLGITAGFFALNGFSVLTLTQAPVSFNMSSERAAIFDYFNDERRAPESLVNYSSWGGYSIHALYAPKNLLVTYAQTLDAAQTQRLLEISRLTKRAIYDVCLDPLRGTMFEGMPVTVDGKSFPSVCSKAFLDNRFGGKLDFEEVLPGLSIWHVFTGTPR